MNYLNTNIQYINYRKTLNRRIYVDKSLMIESLNDLIGSDECYVCVTRPRRFGKTVNANMLGAYYTKGFDSSDLFKDLKISKRDNFRRHLNKYNVIYIDFSRQPDLCNSYEEYITNIVQGIQEDLLEVYPHLNRKKYSMLSAMLADTKDSFIFIMDEWDSIFHESYMSKEDKNRFLKFLKGLLKDQPYVDFAYMTGVLPIAKYSSGSELNIFREYNALNDITYEEYFGITEKEVRELCKIYDKVSYEELKRWYDGYYLSDGSSLFNPRSVTCAMIDGVCQNYWTQTGPMNEIADCIEHNVDEVREDIVKMVSGIPVQVKLQGYSAAELQLDTRDEILSAMVVYGFLSYHDGQIRIPNYELMEKYEAVLARNSMGEVKSIVERSKEMFQATLACDEEKVAAILEYVHDKEIPFLQYNDENSLSCVITLCYLAARDEYNIEREAKAGKGFCDYVFTPKKRNLPAIILELKVGKSVDTAIEQIKEKNYIQKVEQCREVLLVGINYDSDKKHQCRIKKIR